MNKLIEADLYRYCRNTGFNAFITGLRSPGFHYMYFFRKAVACNRKSLIGLFYRFFVRRYMFKYGFQIPISTSIGPGFYIGHFGTIVINENAKIGKNCNVAHGVTIGQANRGKMRGCPVIGDKVWIGTGAVIVGRVSIKSNVLIAPNSFVNFNVPDNSVVLGNPGKIISKANATEGYINSILN
ncbi:MAG: serine acetyltransferase [Bacteroidetes bacterium]|nr:serine acetyltransferase [Bacteroidota bacterium]